QLVPASAVLDVSDADFSFLTTRPPPRSTVRPYTTLFRSRHEYGGTHRHGDPDAVGMYRSRDVLHDVVDGEARVDLAAGAVDEQRSEEHTSELQSRENLVCRLLLETKNLHDEAIRRASTNS